jgi:hypothetical protein
MASFALGFADLLRISTLIIDETDHVESHGEFVSAKVLIISVDLDRKHVAATAPPLGFPYDSA